MGAIWGLPRCAQPAETKRAESSLAVQVIPPGEDASRLARIPRKTVDWPTAPRG